MSHTIRGKKPLLLRVARIRGQLDAVTRALEEEAECGEVLRRIASARGAMNSLMGEVLEEHVRAHAFRPRGRARTTHDNDAAEDMLAVIRSYLK
jgi:DNA-binding FrmR family transcriptional regulator